MTTEQWRLKGNYFDVFRFVYFHQIIALDHSFSPGDDLAVFHKQNVIGELGHVGIVTGHDNCNPFIFN